MILCCSQHTHTHTHTAGWSLSSWLQAEQVLKVPGLLTRKHRGPIWESHSVLSLVLPASSSQLLSEGAPWWSQGCPGAGMRVPFWRVCSSSLKEFPCVLSSEGEPSTVTFLEASLWKGKILLGLGATVVRTLTAEWQPGPANWDRSSIKEVEAVGGWELLPRQPLPKGWTPRGKRSSQPVPLFCSTENLRGCGSGKRDAHSLQNPRWSLKIFSEIPVLESSPPLLSHSSFRDFGKTSPRVTVASPVLKDVSWQRQWPHPSMLWGPFCSPLSLAFIWALKRSLQPYTTCD